MWKFAVILFLAAVCVNAEDEVPQQNGNLKTLLFRNNSINNCIHEDESMNKKKPKIYEKI
jgi:hypothetical protein